VFPSIEQHRALKGFEILERLGSGGAGEVFLGKSKAGRLVAIKVLSDTRERDEAFSNALAREASLCVRLTHPAIVQVRAFVEDEGFAAIVFDYVEGIALARLLRFCSALGARLPDRIGWHVVERVLAALTVAHAQKDEHGQPAPIVHRDVSPSNVLISFQGDVKLTDFGIAKMLGVSPATRVGLVKGTLGCMAPEQARGEPVDERADVYAAGLLAWRLGTGRAPFQ
jgi:eukaryotic-like serine/threonine-protein kinase